MKSNFDKVISVPLECEDVNKTVAQLPRHPDDAEICAVQLKRRLQLKNSHLQEYIRPQMVVKALQMLKGKFSNPFYQDIEINEDFLNKPDEDEMEMDSASQIHEQELDEEYEREQQKAKEAAAVEKEKAPDGEEVELTKEPEAKSGTDADEESEDEYDTRLKSVKNFQSRQENNTCLLPRDMANEIVMNPGKSAIKKPTENKSIQIAPGKMIFFPYQSIKYIDIMQ